MRICVIAWLLLPIFVACSDGDNDEPRPEFDVVVQGYCARSCMVGDACGVVREQPCEETCLEYNNQNYETCPEETHAGLDCGRKAEWVCETYPMTEMSYARTKGCVREASAMYECLGLE